MAKLHKIEMYVTDTREEYSDIARHVQGLFKYTDVLVNHIEAKEAARFQWGDEHILNCDSTTKAEIEDFIREMKWLDDKIVKNADFLKAKIKGALACAGIDATDRNLRVLTSRLYKESEE